MGCSGIVIFCGPPWKYRRRTFGVEVTGKSRAWWSPRAGVTLTALSH